MRPTSVKKLLAGLFILTTIIAATLQCDDPVTPTPPPPPGDLELLEPLGGSGKTVKVGDTVTIRWSLHDRNKVNSVGMSYSLDGGATVPSTQLLYNKSISFPDTTFRWVVQNSQASDDFVLIIWEYNGLCYSGKPSCSTPFDKSDPFAVRQ